MAVINKGYSKAPSGSKLYSTMTTSKNKTVSPINKFDLSSARSSDPFGVLHTLPTSSVAKVNTSKTKNYSTLEDMKKTSSKLEGPIYGPYSTLPKSTSSSSNKSSSSSGGYSGGGGGGASAPTGGFGIDLSDILNSYNASAEAQKQSILNTTAAQQKIYEDALKSAIEELKASNQTQRETLTKSLQRFQEDTAKQRAQQQSNFNANRADLEAQAYLANRQALQSAAARGLGGSGLQQLSQLQNLINQSSATNELASGNTETLTNIAQALARQEEDTTSNLNTLASNLEQKINSMTTENRNKVNALLEDQKSKINEIEKNNASTKAQLQYQEAVRSQEAETQARQFAAQMAASNAASAQSWRMHQEQLAANEKAEAAALNEYNNKVSTNLTNIIKEAQDNMTQASAIKNKKKRAQAVDTAYYTANAALRNFTNANVVDANLITGYEKQLSSLLKNYKK